MGQTGHVMVMTVLVIMVIVAMIMVVMVVRVGMNPGHGVRGTGRWAPVLLPI